MNNEPNENLGAEEIAPQAEKEDLTKEPKKKNILSEVIENFEVIVFSVIAVILIFSLGFRICFVSGDSMNQTLHDRDWVIVSGLGYEPERGDIIVFHMTSDTYKQLNEPMVKRVIAVAGDWIDIDFKTWTVRIADNKNMENAITLDEPYRYLSNSPLLTSTFKYPLEIPEGYIFVMGDNRNGSLDSRDSAHIGLVDTRRVLGKVVTRVYPFEPIDNKTGD